MLSIRLSRTGRKNLPSFRIIVQEKTQAPVSKVVEIIGTYDPKTEPALVKVKKERLDHWLKVGARPTVALAEILVKQDLITLEQVPELVHERKLREAGKKRVSDKKAYKDQVAKEIKKRNEAKQKAQAKPAEKPAEEKKPATQSETKPAEKPVEKPTQDKK